MTNIPITKAIILSTRTQVRTSVRDELKRCSIAAGDILNVRNHEEYREACKAAEPYFFLALDWEIGPELVLDILEKSRSEHSLESRPTFLFAAKLDEKVVAVAAEYHVNKVHTGEITVEKIRGEVMQLVKEVKELPAMRQLMIQVESHRAKNDWSGATQILNQLHTKFPDNTRIMVELAENHLETDNWQDAEVMLNKALGIAPKYARAKHLLARCFLKRGDPDEAIECLKDAQLISPYNVNRLVEMGNLLLELSRPGEAKKAFDKILSFAPDSKKGTTGKSTSMLALGEVNEALGLLREAASARELAAVFNTSAILAIRKGEYAAGLNLYQVAMNALGDRPKVLARLLFNMGLGYHKWDKLNESLMCFQRAIKLDPNYTDAAHNMQILSGQKAAPKVEPATRRDVLPEVASLSVPNDTVITSGAVAMEIADSAPSARSIAEPSFATDLDGVFDEDDF